VAALMRMLLVTVSLFETGVASPPKRTPPLMEPVPSTVLWSKRVAWASGYIWMA
jgi:hypothetical protein